MNYSGERFSLLEDNSGLSICRRGHSSLLLAASFVKWYTGRYMCRATEHQSRNLNPARCTCPNSNKEMGDSKEAIGFSNYSLKGKNKQLADYSGQIVYKSLFMKLFPVNNSSYFMQIEMYQHAFQISSIEVHCIWLERGPRRLRAMWILAKGKSSARSVLCLALGFG